MKTLAIFLAMFCGSFYTSDCTSESTDCKITNLKISIDLESAEEYGELGNLNFKKLIPCVAEEGLLQLEVTCKNPEKSSNKATSYFKISVSCNGENQVSFLKRVNQLKNSVKSFYNL